MSDGYLPPQKHASDKLLTARQLTESKSQATIWSDTRKALVDDLGFVACYIDRNFEIRDTIGNYEQMLALPRKVLNLNFVRMLPAATGMIVDKAIRQCWRNNRPEVIHNLPLERDGQTSLLQVSIQPLAHTLT